MTSIAAMRLEKLNNNATQDTYLAVKWIESGGQQRFKNQVYVPPILSLSVKDPSLASLVEGLFRREDLLVFPNLLQTT